MSYVPTTFTNGQAPGLSATEMNKIGNGIKTNADNIEQLQNDLSDSNENIAKSASDISGLTEKVTKNTNDISELNENLSDYGLNNLFDGSLVQGGFDGITGNRNQGNNRVSSANPITISSGSNIVVKSSATHDYIVGALFNSGAFVKTILVTTTGDATFNITDNANQFYFTVINSSVTITPSTVGHIGVYINNAIESLIARIEALENK